MQTPAHTEEEHELSDEKAAMTLIQHPTHRNAHDEGSWRSLVEDSVLPFSMELPHGRSFRGSVRSSSLFDLSFFSMMSQLHAAHRTDVHIRATPREELIVSFQRTGTLHLTQNGRRARVTPGTFVTFSSFDPVEIEGSDDYTSLCVKVPLSRFRDTPEQLREMTVRTFSADEGLAPAVWTMIDQLEGGIGHTSAASGAKISHHVIGLLEHMFHQQLGEPDVPDETSSEAILGNCQRYIESHLRDPDLTPRRVAEANFISTRYLHLLFEQTDTTVSAHIREQRIERVRDDLLDPRLSGCSIEALARKWGFLNVSHFGQLFKKTTGYSPGQYRSLAFSTD